MSRYPLTISTEYVPDWTHVEAVRELFQNAKDNEIESPENTMYWEYEKETGFLRIGNKTSKLHVSSLLLGASSKRKNKETIGTHGEGYKIAFMVLLRLGKAVTVYNYGAKEIWTTRLVNSRQYGAKVPTVIVTKAAIWKTVPSHDLMIEVQGITEDEYKELEKYNLHLQVDKLKPLEIRDKQSTNRVIVESEEYRGNIYVGGLYVTNLPNLTHGYDFAPQFMPLDRDRRMLSTFNVVWETTKLWKALNAQIGENPEESDARIPKLLLGMIENTAQDIQYWKDTVQYSDTPLCVEKEVLENYEEAYGPDSTPVTNQKDMERVQRAGGRPVVVPDLHAAIISNARDTYRPERLTVKIKTTKEELEGWLQDVSERLTEDEIADFQNIIKRV